MNETILKLIKENPELLKSLLFSNSENKENSKNNESQSPSSIWIVALLALFASLFIFMQKEPINPLDNQDKYYEMVERAMSKYMHEQHNKEKTGE